jgi:hypothetical protein
MTLPKYADILADSPDVLQGINVARVAQYQQRPEWIRVDGAIKLFGLSRTKLYELITDRKIKSFCLRERNKIKGIRLISYDSLDQFLKNEAKAQEAAVLA